MSESLLKAILRLFAVVAKEDEVTHHERDLINSFLEEHLSGPSVQHHLQIFDELTAQNISRTLTWEEEIARLNRLCEEVSRDLTQKQKVVILLELISIIQADGAISDREAKLADVISE